MCNTVWFLHTEKKQIKLDDKKEVCENYYHKEEHWIDVT